MKFVSVSLLAIIVLAAVFAAGRQTTKTVRFLHIADTHGQLDTHWEYLPEDPDHLHRMGGFARIRTALDQRRASATGAVFTVDGGDTFQGSAIAAWTKGQAILVPLNALNIDVATPGNWEFVYGPDVFRGLMAQVREKVVCFNLNDKATGERLFPPATVIDRGGVRVAFVGVTDIGTSVRQAPAEVRGLDTTRIQGLRHFVQDLKTRERPDLTVLVDHTGLAPSVQLAHDIPEFDIVLSGHTHERVYKPILVGKTIVVEPGSMGSFLGQLDITLKAGAVSDYQYELVGIEEDRFSENSEVKAMIDRSERPYEQRLRTVIGKATGRLLRYDVLESSMDNLIADAVREATHADIGLTNGFRFSPPVPAGPITEADLWNMLPLDARIKTGVASGRQLHPYLGHEMELVFSSDPFKLSGGWGPRPSGMTVLFQAKAAPSERIKNVRIAGAQLGEDQMYSVAGCERDGEPLDVICRLRGTADPAYAAGTIHSVLETYIRSHSPISPDNRNRVVATDLPRRIWSQYGALQKMWQLPGDAAGVAVPALPAAIHPQ